MRLVSSVTCRENHIGESIFLSYTTECIPAGKCTQMNTFTDTEEAKKLFQSMCQINISQLDAVGQ